LKFLDKVKYNILTNVNLILLNYFYMVKLNLNFIILHSEISVFILTKFIQFIAYLLFTTL